MKLNSKPYVIVFLVLLLVSAGCSRKRSTVVSRTYHNLPAHYNGYFNARERTNEVATRVFDGQADKFERVLDIYKFGDANGAKANFPDLDESIKKTSLVIQRHSIKIKGKEHCKWIDENYLEVGRAQFYKHDYWSAIETFQFTSSEFKESNSRFTAMMWLTLTYMQLGKMLDAEYVLDFLNNQTKMTRAQLQMLNLIKADFNYKKDDIPNTIKFLEEALKHTRKKQEKARYRFILAQLYQKQGETKKAYDLFGKVIKMNPSYEFSFNAKINRARSFDASSEGSGKVKKQLLKMAKDAKNKEYLDQIYYALAGIAKTENKEEEEISLLKKSVSTSMANVNQKAISYLELGEIYFSKKNYRYAQAYYDSTIQFLTKDFPGYEQIANKQLTLKRLIENIMVIEQEDSLQALAKLSKEELEKYVEELIEKENEEAERKKQEEEARKVKELEEQNNANMALMEENQKQNSGFIQPGSGGSWYFYNQSTISFGFNEFVKKWGNRPLEDNWRRKDKESVAITQVEDEDEKTDTIAKVDMASLNKAKKEAYLKKIPQGEKALKASDAKIDEAYYNIGIIYRESLKEYPESRDNFEKLLVRFPESNYKLPTYYNLYRLYSALGDPEKSEYYKNLLLNKHGDSEFAQMILNPEYFNSKQQKADIIRTYYENTYRAYLNKQYAAVIERKNEADSMFPPSALTPKFDFLKTLSIGHLRPVRDFELSLRDIIARYPADSVSGKAKEILDYITKNSLSQSTQKTEADTTQQVKESDGKIPEGDNEEEAQRKMEEELEAKKKLFSFNEDTTHYTMFVFENSGFNSNEFKIKVSNFNSKYYSINSLQINSAMFNSDKQYVTIRQFGKNQEAMDYMNTLMSSEEVFDENSNYEYQLFIISPANFNKLVVNKELDAYINFFDENYNQ
ncbi:MAG: tetratricopeptide repeat protein [Bacteroidetes bacterium]|nr:tetratricopeptide repeat protein [Bacteroidota bacterium]